MSCGASWGDPISEDMLSCLLPQRLQLHIKVRSQLSGKSTPCGHQPLPQRSPPEKSLRRARCQSTPSKSHQKPDVTPWFGPMRMGREGRWLTWPLPRGLMVTCPWRPAMMKQLARSCHGPRRQPHRDARTRCAIRPPGQQFEDLPRTEHGPNHTGLPLPKLSLVPVLQRLLTTQCAENRGHEAALCALN